VSTVDADLTSAKVVQFGNTRQCAPDPQLAGICAVEGPQYYHARSQNHLSGRDGRGRRELGGYAAPSSRYYPEIGRPRHRAQEHVAPLFTFRRETER